MPEAPTSPFNLPAPATPLQFWYQNQSLVEGLRNLLADPVFLQARAMVEFHAVGERTGSLGQKPDVLLARELAFLAGIRHAFDDLNRLARPPRTHDQPEEEGWGYVKAHRVPVGPESLVETP